MKQLGQHPPPRHTVAHPSDPHLLAGGVRQYGVIDTEAGLQRALGRLTAIDPAPQALVLTGDLADRGDPAPVDRLVSGVDGDQSFTMVHAYDDRLVHTIVPVATSLEVTAVPADLVPQLERLSIEEAREPASSKSSPFNLGDA